jgi:RNA polymerase sigma-70 factor (ECF subfamily)
MGLVTDQLSDPTADQPHGAEELQRWCAEYRNRLRAIVQVRLSPKLAGRLDPSDVVQEALVEATERYADYCRNPSMSPYLWLRFLTLQRLKILHRQHLQTRKRAADREAVLPELEVSSVVLAQWLVDSGTSPSKSAMKREQHERLHEALEAMSPLDREILVLRHFEQLSTAESAQVLEITHAAAHRRYYRALERLREIIEPIMDNSQAS